MFRNPTTSLRLGIWLLAACTLIWFYTSARVPAFGQNQAAPAVNPAAAGAAADSGPAKPNEESLGHQVFVKSGTFGFVFYLVLGIFSIVALAVAIERAINLRSDKIIPPQFTATLENSIRSGHESGEDFRQICDRFPSPIANILRSAAVRAGRPLAEVEKAMEDSALREVSILRGRNRVLTVIASTAPLVGLLGTVVGMIFAFRTSSQEGLGSGKAELLAEGIYLALMTTAAGLTIAIPCMLLAAWFNSRVEKYLWQMDEKLLATLPSFTRMEIFDGTVEEAEIDSPAPALAK